MMVTMINKKQLIEKIQEAIDLDDAYLKKYDKLSNIMYYWHMQGLLCALQLIEQLMEPKTLNE